MFAGSMDGYMYALNAATGKVLWSYQGAGSSNAGPAIGLDGTVYWGNGYSQTKGRNGGPSLLGWWAALGLTSRFAGTTDRVSPGETLLSAASCASPLHERPEPPSWNE
jgi:hypothetical protein